jgi:hypothetical protein
VSWTAASGGVDNGGYIVVRGTVDPTTAPNVNGIYNVGNTVVSGQTVVYIGTGTSFTDTGLTAGTQYFYRVYTFDKAYNYSAASTANGTTLKTTTTGLISSLNPSSYGSSVTFTATVTGSSGTPTGAVTFKDGSTTLGTGTLSGGTTTYTTSSLSVGSHSITAVYEGDSSFNTSTSSTLTQTVNTASTATTVSSSVNPTFYKQYTTLTATVTGSGATGTVTFKDGATTIGTGTLSGGTAILNINTLSVGSHSITAVYGGDSNFDTSTSPAITQIVNAIPVIISEFRFGGPGGSSDEFIELYNTTNAPYNISGYQLIFSDNTPMFDITSGTIPARGHFLIANSDGYSLGGVATADMTYSGVDRVPSAGVALQTTGANPALLDSVGFTNTVPPAGFVEGTGLSPTASSAQYSYPRKIGTTGFPQDTDNNANDFWLVATDTTAVGDATAVLGAPGPENTSSPTNKTAQLKSSLLNPNVSSTSSPNQVRDTTPGGTGTPTEVGTLTLRRYFTNTTGAPVSTLRLRISNITTTNSPGAGPAQADVRMLTSTGETLVVNSVSVDVRGLTLEAPAVTPPGGGYNVTLLVDLSALPGGVLANGDSVAVNILLGVAKGGTYRLAYTVEAATTP